MMSLLLAAAGAVGAGDDTPVLFYIVIYAISE